MNCVIFHLTNLTCKFLKSCHMQHMHAGKWQLHSRQGLCLQPAGWPQAPPAQQVMTSPTADKEADQRH